MLSVLEPRVCGESLVNLAESCMMWTALDKDGTLLHMSPHFAQLLLGDGAKPADQIGVSLARVLGDRYGGERVRLVQRSLQNGHTLVTRSVIRGLQYVSHIHPATRPGRAHDPIAVVFHHACDGPVCATDFERAEYIEAVNNSYGPLASLSRREIEVAAMLARGLDAKQIAVQLSRSLETICSHKKSLFAKIGVDSQLQAAIIVRRAGLTERDVPRIAMQQRLPNAT
jgi:DNA-binding CsgD family transcriptional regulator